MRESDLNCGADKRGKSNRECLYEMGGRFTGGVEAMPSMRRGGAFIKKKGGKSLNDIGSQVVIVKKKGTSGFGSVGDTTGQNGQNLPLSWGRGDWGSSRHQIGWGAEGRREGGHKSKKGLASRPTAALNVS